MATKIAKGAGCIEIGESDYPVNSFRAIYSATHLTLIVKDYNLIKAPSLKFRYTDLVDEADAPMGTTAAVVRPKIQAIIYSEAAPAAPEV